MLINKIKNPVNNQSNIVINRIIKNDKRELNLIIQQKKGVIKKSKQVINKKQTT